MKALLSFLVFACGVCFGDGIALKVDGLKEGDVVSVVVEDVGGTRVRNVVSGALVGKDGLKVEWDGRDEFGGSVKPGTYRYRGLVHEGIEPEILMQFVDGGENRGPYAWGPDHSTFMALAGNGEAIFAAAPVAECGNALVELSAEGDFRRAFSKPHPYGVDRVAIAATEEKLVVVFEGTRFSDLPENGGKPRIGFVVYDLKGGHQEGKSTYVAEGEKSGMLAGCAMAGGRLYIANADAGEVLEVDVKSREGMRRIAAAGVSAIAGDGEQLFVACGRGVYAMGEAGLEPQFEVGYDVMGMSVREGVFALLGNPDGTVALVKRDGKRVGTIGEAGGAYAGRWRPRRLVNAVGVLLAHDGTVWTAEKRRNPKRLVRWTRDGKIVREKVGSPSYGSPTMGFDGEDGSRVVACGVEWKLDFQKKMAEPVNVLLKEDLEEQWWSPLQSQFVRYRGRTFLLGGGQVASVSELRKDGTLRLMAFFTNVHQFSIRRPIREGACPGFDEMIEKRYLTDPTRMKNFRENRLGMFWSDVDGDGEVDEEEFVLFPEGSYPVSFWGWTGMDLAFRVPFQDKASGKEYVVEIAPDGFWKNGVLKYDAEGALKRMAPIEAAVLPGTKGFVSWGQPAGDLRGNVVVNREPWMMSFSGSGKLNWFFPNRWADVHGSQVSPLPQRGVLQSLLFAMGTAPLDEEGDVMAFMGNQGRVALMTTDGLYLEQIFADARVHAARDFGTMMDEPFGGTFQYDRKRKQYLLQGGKNTYRVYRVKGLDKVRRFRGEVTLSAEEIAEANASGADQVEETERVRYARVPAQGEAVLARWENATTWMTVHGGVDATNLVLRYEYDDPSPWANKGTDWRMLFKTGDSVDLQLSLTKTDGVKPRVKEAVGDLRLLAAPFGEGSIAVLYRYKVAEGETGAEPHGFSSPWRTYTVADVKRLEAAKVEPVVRGKHVAVTVTLPLASLGVTAEEMAGLHWGDFGVLFSDAEGELTMRRSYWANQKTGIVSDVPAEIIPQVKEWGLVEWARKVGTCEARVVGSVGNSGTAAEPVLFGEIRSTRPHGQNQAGPVWDAERGLLYQTAGTEWLNTYRLDGTLAARYSIPAGAFRTRNDPLVRVGDALYFRRNEELWMLPQTATNGSAAVRAPCELKKIKLLSSSARDGELAILLNDNTLHLWNASTGESRQIAKEITNYANILDWNRDGELMAMREVEVSKVVNGTYLREGEYPRQVIGRGVSVNAGGIVNGAIWGTGGCGTVLRFDEKTGEPAPGVVFGGRGGHTLNYIFADMEIGDGSGIAYLGDDLYAVGGSSGIVMIMKWDAREERLTRVRRIGAMREVKTLCLSKDGCIGADGVVYRWNDDKDSPIHSSWRIGGHEVVASTVVGDGMDAMRVGVVGHNGHPIVEFGPFRETGRNRPCTINPEWGAFTNVAGIAAAKRRAFVVDRDGATRVYAYHYDHHRMSFRLLTNAVLHVEAPVTDLAAMDETTVALMAGGEIRLLKIEGDTLTEAARLPLRIEGECRLAADAEQIVVSERAKNRVTIYSRTGDELGRLDVSAPGAVAIRGSRLVVYSSAEQRLVKVELRDVQK